MKKKTIISIICIVVLCVVTGIVVYFGMTEVTGITLSAAEYDTYVTIRDKDTIEKIIDLCKTYDFTKVTELQKSVNDGSLSLDIEVRYPFRSREIYMFHTSYLYCIEGKTKYIAEDGWNLLTELYDIRRQCSAMPVIKSEITAVDCDPYGELPEGDFSADNCKNEVLAILKSSEYIPVESYDYTPENYRPKNVRVAFSDGVTEITVLPGDYINQESQHYRVEGISSLYEALPDKTA